MAKIPPLRRFLAEDFPTEVQKWIGALLTGVNNYFEQNTSALNKGLTITDNFAGAIKTAEIDGVFPVRISWDLAGKPQTVLVGDVKTASGVSATLLRAPGVQWSFNQSGELQIDDVFGILPDIKTFVDAAVSTGSDTISLPAHDLQTADKIALSTTGTLPTGLLAQNYYVIRDTAHTIKLATSASNARAGTAVNITAAAGGGTHIITPQYSSKYRLILECKIG